MTHFDKAFNVDYCGEHDRPAFEIAVFDGAGLYIRSIFGRLSLRDPAESKSLRYDPKVLNKALWNHVAAREDFPAGYNGQVSCIPFFGLSRDKVVALLTGNIESLSVGHGLRVHKNPDENPTQLGEYITLEESALLSDTHELRRACATHFNDMAAARYFRRHEAHFDWSEHDTHLGEIEFGLWRSASEAGMRFEVKFEAATWKTSIYITGRANNLCIVVDAAGMTCKYDGGEIARFTRSYGEMPAFYAYVNAWIDLQDPHMFFGNVGAVHKVMNQMLDNEELEILRDRSGTNFRLRRKSNKGVHATLAVFKVGDIEGEGFALSARFHHVDNFSTVLACNMPGEFPDFYSGILSLLGIDNKEAK